MRLLGGTRKDPNRAVRRPNKSRGRCPHNWSVTVDRAKKEEVVSELTQIFTDSGAVVVSHYTGMTVAEMTAFRAKIRESGGQVRVAKNRLAKIALQGHPAEGLGDILTGMTVFAYAEDPVSIAKAVEDYAKGNQKLEILGGVLGPSVIDRDGVTAVSKMPSREEVIASIVGCLGAPASGLAGALGAPGSGIAGALAAPAGGIAGILATLEARDAA